MRDIERLARALCIADGLDPDVRVAGQFIEERAAYELIPRWQVRRRAVTALLQELREPSEGMISEAVSEYVGDVDAQATWQAMIDHILTEGAER